MHGVLENIEEKRSQRGEPYWALSISGTRYTVWDKSLISGTRAGDHVGFSFVRSGQYRKIVELSKSSPQNLTRWMQFQDDRGKRIVRMSCLKTAAVVINGKTTVSIRRARAVLEIARLFERHINGDQEERSRRAG